jgi:DNA repair protein RadD
MGFQYVDRPYQTQAVASVWNYFRENKGNPVIAMPTGTGKSVVIARFLQSVFENYPNQKVMILTHVKELISQNYGKLMGLWPFAPAGIFSAGLNRKDHRKPITFGGIGSVWKAWALFGHVDLIMIDEAHLVSPTDSTMYQSFVRGLMSINPHLKVIGLTATPWRLGHGKITDPVVKVVGGREVEEPSLFTDICFDITGIESFNRLIAEGYLTPLVPPRRMKTELNLDGVHMRGGEFIEKELQTAVDKAEITEAALREVLEVGHDRRKWLIFASGTDHADHIADMLNAFGIPTGSVHSKRKDRDDVIAAFLRGELRAVVNNNVLTTGFDDPEIDMIVVLRPTASSVLWVQMLGRGTRPLYAEGYDLNTIDGRLQAIAAGGKTNCLVVDFARNTKRLGPINDPVVPQRKGKGGGEAPVKDCPVCDSTIHASLRFCNGLKLDGSGEICGHEFVFDSKLKQAASTDELIKGDLPVVKVFKVDHVTYDKHQKLGAPDMIKVNYYSGTRRFNEYVCPGHTNWAFKKAQRWWQERDGGDMPASAAEALVLIDQLKVPTHLRVWTNKKYPEILATCFDGSAFGEQEPNDDRPQVDVNRPQTAPNYMVDMDDDIPF